MPVFDVPAVIGFTVAFFLISIASRQIGTFFSAYGLPYITGYLLAGALAGPFILGLVETQAIDQLRYIDDVSLAVIAFIAGSELYLKELRDRLRSILLNTVGIVIAAFTLIGITIFIVQNFVAFTADFPVIQKVAVSILGATILLALSPASTIAVMQEVRARGPFSKTVLSITVVMDVVIIVLFAISVALASALIENEPLDAQFAILLVIDIAIALLAGYLIGLFFRLMLSTSLGTITKAAIMLLVGLIVFEAGYRVPDWTSAAFGVKIKIEPLLISMVAGFTVTNFTPYRHEFEDILHQISPFVYVAFFTLTGIALKLDVLFATIGVALILFLVRMIAIVAGTYVGGTLAGESPVFRRWAGLGLITQAGIALGLARETATEFTSLGSEFATLIISVVVLNEIFGPLLLKYSLRQTGETHEAVKGELDDVRDVLILGVEPQSIALARQLTSNGWQVIVADTDQEQVERMASEDVDERHITAITVSVFSELVSNKTDALVAMMEDDHANYSACELAYEKFGIRKLVVYLKDTTLRPQFEELGVRIIDTSSAMVNLLDQYVRAPEAAELLMHHDPTYDLRQITIREKSVDGMLIRDLRLPTDVLVLEINRSGNTIVPHGYSKIQIDDEVTLVGKPDSLQQATLKLGF
jgi:Trk K+ transport system NAD-binding subunit/Kef-type K+ transport system membrane component KefB